MADKEMKVVFERPHALLPVVTNYCPGCSHGIVNRLVAECLDELDVEGSTVGIAPVGCTVTSYDFYGCDMIEAAHGRADLLADGFDQVTVDTVMRLVDRAEWKRRQYPLGPKVTALAFGRDRRLPVTNAFRE